MKKQMILLGMLMAFCMAEAKVTLPALFTDNMVLQQKSNVIFHGHSCATVCTTTIPFGRFILMLVPLIKINFYLPSAPCII